MKGVGKFNPEFYLRFRPLYPVETFSGLRQELVRRGFREPFRIADIGCGTGHSAASLLRSGISAEIIGVDPDPGMIAHAAENLATQVGSGESTGLAGQSIDAVLVGSAFHWMDAELARDEFVRILKPRGLVRIFEYQFPKAVSAQELNEWIRRQFNLRWKAPGQVPRGDFQQVTNIFARDSRFKPTGQGRPPMILDLGWEELAGLILSQSRVLHYEQTLSESDRAGFIRTLGQTLREFLAERRIAFDFRLAWVEFGLGE